MRKTKMKKTRSIKENATPNRLKEREDEEDKINQNKGFYACYLLTSLCPRFKGHTYIGFTVNPRRRIRQHNGEIRSGAFRTKKRRPWEMVFCIYGFPTNVSALQLQFEWAWQHPTESLAVREAAATFKSFSGVANKIKLACTMLSLPAWQSMNITVNYFSTKYLVHSAACPSLLEHMKVQVCPIDELPCYSKIRESFFECGDAEYGLDDKENYETTTNVSGAIRESLTELRGHSIIESPIGDREDSSSELGASSNGNNDGEEYNEVSYASGTVKEADANITAPLPSDNLHNIDAASYEKFGWLEEHNKEQQQLKNMSADYRTTMKVDNVQPYVFIHSPVKTASSVLNTYSMEETLPNKKNFGLDLQNEKKLSGKVDTDQPSLNSYTFPHEIEVIDLLSPSPECRIMSSRKKRRVLTDFPEIIDLT